MSGHCNTWSQQVVDWSDVNLGDLERLVDLAGELISVDCGDICAMKFLLADALQYGVLRGLVTSEQLLDHLMQNYDGNSLVPELLYAIGRYDVLRKLGVPKETVENRLEATYCPFISNYRKTLHALSRNMDSRDLAMVSLLCSSKLDRQTLAAAKCGHHLFTALEKGDWIKQSDVSFLIGVLRGAKLFKLANQLTAYANSGVPDRTAVDVSRGGMMSESSGIPTTAGEFSAAEFSITPSSSGATGKATATVRPTNIQRGISEAPSDASFSSQNSQSSADLEEDSKKVSKQQLSTELEQVRKELENLKLSNSRFTQESYDMRHKPRGLCLIVNIEKFFINKFRKGSEIDCDVLEKTFGKLNFLVKTSYDCDYESLTRLLDSYRRRDHTWYDCFVLCLMSHGSDGHIVTADDKAYSIKKIMKLFDGKMCPSLAGKPKLFFVQACQGRERMEPAFELENDLEEDSRTDDPGIPAMSDFVLSMATFPGHTAFRSKSEGSWFIVSLCEVLNEKWENMHLADMLIEVNNRVAQAKAGQGFSFHKQCPTPTITLRKALWFNPLDKVYEADADDQ